MSKTITFVIVHLTYASMYVQRGVLEPTYLGYPIHTFEHNHNCQIRNIGAEPAVIMQAPPEEATSMKRAAGIRVDSGTENLSSWSQCP